MRLGIVGCGNMAQAMVRRWLDAGELSRGDVRACTSRPETAAQVAAALGVTASASIAETVAGADVVLLACKPQQRTAVLAACAAAADSEPLWISVLAGVDVAQLQTGLGTHSRVVRWMPNTPVAIGAGLVAHCAGARVTPADCALQARLIAPLGDGLALDESRIDAFTAIAGCGPAYVYRLVEGLQTAAGALGFEPSLAAQLAAGTVHGAALWLHASGLPAAVLRSQVTSKGGMTEAALQALDAVGWAERLTDAATAAEARAAVLAGRKPSD